MNLCDNVFIPEGTFQVTGSVKIKRSGIRLFNLGKTDCPNGVKGDRNWICDIAIEGGAIIINSDNLSDQQ